MPPPLARIPPTRRPSLLPDRRRNIIIVMGHTKAKSKAPNPMHSIASASSSLSSFEFVAAAAEKNRCSLALASLGEKERKRKQKQKLFKCPASCVAAPLSEGTKFQERFFTFECGIELKCVSLRRDGMSCVLLGAIGGRQQQDRNFHVKTICSPFYYRAVLYREEKKEKVNPRFF